MNLWLFVHAIQVHRRQMLGLGILWILVTNGFFEFTTLQWSLEHTIQTGQTAWPISQIRLASGLTVISPISSALIGVWGSTLAYGDLEQGVDVEHAIRGVPLWRWLLMKFPWTLLIALAGLAALLLIGQNLSFLPAGAPAASPGGPRLLLWTAWGVALVAWILWLWLIGIYSTLATRSLIGGILSEVVLEAAILNPVVMPWLPGGCIVHAVEQFTGALLASQSPVPSLTHWIRLSPTSNFRFHWDMVNLLLSLLTMTLLHGLAARRYGHGVGKPRF